MTNENGNKNAPAEKPLAQGERGLAAPQQREKPAAKWRVRALAVAGLYGALACGGSGATNELPPVPDLPGGVCANIAARISPEGDTSLSLNEAKLSLGGTAYLTDDALVKVTAMADTASGTKVTLALVDKDGNSLSNILDPSDGSTIPAASSPLAPGESWTFVKDNVRYTVTVCAVLHTESGDYAILSSVPGYDWCAPLDRTTAGATSTYATNTYGTERITATVRQVGEVERRDDAECAPVAETVMEETAALERPMRPGVQPADSIVKVLGEVWEVIELDASGRVLLAKSLVSGEVGVGETLITNIDGLELIVAQVANYDGVYKANLVVSVPDFELELVEGAVAGTLVRVGLPSGDAYVRVNAVNEDGTVELEVLDQARTMSDGGSWEQGEETYSVTTVMDGSSLTGWALTLD